MQSGVFDCLCGEAVRWQYDEAAGLAVLVGADGGGHPCVEMAGRLKVRDDARRALLGRIIMERRQRDLAQERLREHERSLRAIERASPQAPPPPPSSPGRTVVVRVPVASPPRTTPQPKRKPGDGPARFVRTDGTAR